MILGLHQSVFVWGGMYSLYWEEPWISHGTIYVSTDIKSSLGCSSLEVGAEVILLSLGVKMIFAAPQSEVLNKIVLSLENLKSSFFLNTLI